MVYTIQGYSLWLWEKTADFLMDQIIFTEQIENEKTWELKGWQEEMRRA
jgi:hypothetical protein